MRIGVRVKFRVRIKVRVRVSHLASNGAYDTPRQFIMLGHNLITLALTHVTNQLQLVVRLRKVQSELLDVTAQLGNNK